MSNQQLPEYYHLKMKQMEIIRPEPLQVTLAVQRIFDLDDLENQRRIDRPGVLNVMTRQELEQFLRDDRVLAQRYDGFVAKRSKDLLTSPAHLQCSGLC